MKKIVLILFSIFSINVSATTIEAFVSILPQQYFVERIGGEQVEVHVMVKPGQSPETFEPSPKIMAAYTRSDVHFKIGMPFEKVWINRVASLNPRISIVDTQPDKHLLMRFEEHEHHHEHHGDNDEHNWDPHTWLSPVIALQQAKIIVDELSRLSPENKDYFYNNYNKLMLEVKVVHDALAKRFNSLEKTSFITFHPAFGYFAREYGLTQLAIEIDGKEPTAKQIATIVEQIKNKNVSYILIEKQFNKVIPKTIADSIGAELLILDPLAFNYIDNIQDIADKIKMSLF